MKEISITLSDSDYALIQQTVSLYYWHKCHRKNEKPPYVTESLLIKKMVTASLNRMVRQFRGEGYAYVDGHWTCFLFRDHDIIIDKEISSTPSSHAGSLLVRGYSNSSTLEMIARSPGPVRDVCIELDPLGAEELGWALLYFANINDSMKLYDASFIADLLTAPLEEGGSPPECCGFSWDSVGRMQLTLKEHGPEVSEETKTFTLQEARPTEAEQGLDESPKMELMSEN